MPDADSQAFDVYVINMDRSLDRLALMTDELARVGLAWRRARGLPGTDLPEPWRPMFADAGRLKPGEVGCFVSHLAVLSAVADATEGRPALVLEDDSLLPPDFRSILGEILRAVPAGWDMVRLSNRPKRAYVPFATLSSGHELIRYSKTPSCSTAYLVSPGGARKLLRPGPKTLTYDEYLRRPWLHDAESIGIWPALVSSPDIASTIDASGERGRDPRSKVVKSLFKMQPLLMGARVTWQARHLGLGRWIACGFTNAVDGVARVFGTTMIHRAARVLAVAKDPDPAGPRRCIRHR